MVFLTRLKIVLLLSQRQICIEKAALVKKKKSLVVDNKRIDEVISKVSNFGVDWIEFIDSKILVRHIPVR